MRLLEFLQKIEHHRLMEGVKDRYMAQMMAVPAALRDSAPMKQEMANDVDWAIRVLKRQDRIVWYLRLKRIDRAAAQRNFLERQNLTPEQQAQAKELNDWIVAEGSRLLQKMGEPQFKDGERWNMSLGLGFEREIGHFMGMNLPKINQIVFGWQNPELLIREMSEIEKEWQKQVKGLIGNQEGIEKIIEFPDGSAWFNLHRMRCSVEANAMGHCGNSQDIARERDTLLSFRVPKQVEGQTMWEPHMTFVLDTENGMLGEMKGKSNNKPVERYYPYIIKLLEHPLVKGIRGGGYEAHKNFTLGDLPQPEADRLAQMKPGLADPPYILKKFGPAHPMFYEKARAILDAATGKDQTVLEPYDPVNKGFVIDRKLSDIESFVHSWGSERDTYWALAAAKLASGDGEFYDYSFRDVPLDDIDAILTDLKKKYPTSHANLQRYVWSEYNEACTDLGNQSPTDLTDDEMLRILDDNDDEIIRAGKSAVILGMEVGAQNDAYEQYLRWLGNPTGDHEIFVVWGSEKNPKAQDTDVRVMIEPQALAVALGQVDEIENNGGDWQRLFTLRDMDEPRYGWQGYDREAAFERFLEEVNIPFVEPEKPEPVKKSRKKAK
jgi:hypothetical protein